MFQNRISAGIVSAALLLAPAVSYTAPPVPQEPAADTTATPQEIGLRELAFKRLFQLDVTVRGPEAAIENLTPEDFELIIAGKPVNDFSVDRICRDPAESVAVTYERVAPESLPDGSQSISAPADPAEPRLGPTSFLIYFDQPFLTMAGRNESIRIAKELIPELITGGNRAMVVSNSEVLSTYSDLTGDVTALLEAIDRVYADPQQWNPFAITEESRIQEVMRVFRDRGYPQAGALARQYQLEEQWKTDKALRRLSMVLARLGDIQPPKAVIYFADRMRSMPGLHYQSYFANYQIDNSSALSRMTLTAMQGKHAFDTVLEEANAHGMRIYTIQAEGMAQLNVNANMPTSVQAGKSTTGHIRSAQDSLVGMSLETGGKAFLNGVAASKIIRNIQADLSCLYLISFDPTGMIEDEPLAVTLRTFNKKVEARTRGQIVILSENALRHSRLLGAFAAPDLARSTIGARAAVIPTGYSSGKYTALVQFAVDGGPLHDPSWDLGISLLSRGEVREDSAGRIVVKGSGSIVVLETEMSFAPGPYELVMVAQESETRQIASAKVEGSWPDPDEASVTVGPIAVVQPSSGAFLRDGELRRSGPLGIESESSLRADLPTALVSLICRARTKKGNLQVTRRLIGSSAAEFDPMELDLGKERCVQIRDLISADTMTTGGFVYQIDVLDKATVITSGSRSFSAIEQNGEPVIPPTPADLG